VPDRQTQTGIGNTEAQPGTPLRHGTSLPVTVDRSPQMAFAPSVPAIPAI